MRHPWLALMVIIPLAGCVKTKPTLVAIDSWAYRADSGVVATEAILSHAGQMTPARSREILTIAKPIAEIGLQATHVLQAWQPGQPMPDTLPKLIEELYDLVRLLIRLLPPEQARVLLAQPRVTPRDLSDELARLDVSWRGLLEEIAARLAALGNQ